MTIIKQEDVPKEDFDEGLISVTEFNEFIRKLKEELKSPKFLRGYNVQVKWFKEIIDELIEEVLK